MDIVCVHIFIMCVYTYTFIRYPPQKSTPLVCI